MAKVTSFGDFVLMTVLPQTCGTVPVVLSVRSVSTVQYCLLYCRVQLQQNKLDISAFSVEARSLLRLERDDFL